MLIDVHIVIEVPPANFWYTGLTAHLIHVLQNFMGYKWNSNSWGVSVSDTCVGKNCVWMWVKNYCHCYCYQRIHLHYCHIYCSWK